MSDGAAQLKEIRECLVEHEKRFDQHDKRFDRLEERMERGFSEMGVQFEQLQSTLRLLAEPMSDFSRANSHLDGRVDILEEQHRLTDFRLKMLEKRP